MTKLESWWAGVTARPHRVDVGAKWLVAVRFSLVHSRLITVCNAALGDYRAMHSAKRGLAIALSSVCPSVSVCDVGGLWMWSHRLEFFRNNFTISEPAWNVRSLQTQTRGHTSRGTPGNFGPKWPTPCWFERRRTFDRKLRPNGYR